MIRARFCKTCQHLRRVALPECDDYAYNCGWRNTLTQDDFPWAERLLAAVALTGCGSGIGKRHVEGDWSEVMDCAKWEQKGAKT